MEKRSFSQRNQRRVLGMHKASTASTNTQQIANIVHVMSSVLVRHGNVTFGSVKLHSASTRRPSKYAHMFVRRSDMWQRRDK